MADTEVVKGVEVRVHAEYQLLHIEDMDGGVWARLVLGEAKRKGYIKGYSVDLVEQGPMGLQFITFSVDAGMSESSYDMYKMNGAALLNELFNDTDVRIRFVTLP